MFLHAIVLVTLFGRGFCSSEALYDVVSWFACRWRRPSPLFVLVPVMEAMARDPRLAGRVPLGPYVSWSDCVSLSRFVVSLQYLAAEVLARQSPAFQALAASAVRLDILVNGSSAAPTADEALLA